MSHSLPNSLSGIVATAAMRRQVNRLHTTSTISSAIATLVKYKISGLLVVDENEFPLGVVSKTNIVTAYYAQFPLDSPLEHIMTGPPIFCQTDDPLEHALQIMKDSGIYRLYVKEPVTGAVDGVLAYPDIVGMLYEFCSQCDHSIFNRSKDPNSVEIRRSYIGECMTGKVHGVATDKTLHQVLEKFAMYQVGALLVIDSSGRGCGVISKTDLILAYNHNVPLDTHASDIMSTPLRNCREGDLLEEAIRSMIFSDVHRLFVTGIDNDEIVGVFSLTDAARCKSGSCHACLSSRIRIQSDQ